MASLEEFNRRVNKFARGLGPDLVKPFHAKLHLLVGEGLILGTRVDTGRARGNWQSSEGRPATGQLERLDRNGSAPLAEGRRTARTIKPYTVSYWNNNVPYIGFLDDLDGFIAASIERAGSIF